jgi:hypothetical protein
MSISPSLPQTQPLLLDVSHTTLHITAEQFDRLCVDNTDLVGLPPKKPPSPKVGRRGRRL